jgi:hypothetical protein
VTSNFGAVGDSGMCGGVVKAAQQLEGGSKLFVGPATVVETFRCPAVHVRDHVSAFVVYSETVWSRIETRLFEEDEQPSYVDGI